MVNPIFQNIRWIISLTDSLARCPPFLLLHGERLVPHVEVGDDPAGGGAVQREVVVAPQKRHLQDLPEGDGQVVQVVVVRVVHVQQLAVLAK